MEKYNENEGRWVTIKGARVFIKHGQTLSEAFKNNKKMITMSANVKPKGDNKDLKNKKFEYSERFEFYAGTSSREIVKEYATKQVNDLKETAENLTTKYSAMLKLIDRYGGSSKLRIDGKMLSGGTRLGGYIRLNANENLITLSYGNFGHEFRGFQDHHKAYVDGWTVGFGSTIFEKSQNHTAATLTHEFGHLMMKKMWLLSLYEQYGKLYVQSRFAYDSNESEELQKYYREFGILNNQFSLDMHNRLVDDHKEELEKMSKSAFRTKFTPSQYANTSPEEWFAEWFVKYNDNLRTGHRDIFHDAFEKTLEEYIENYKKGLKDFWKGDSK